MRIDDQHTRQEGTQLPRQKRAWTKGAVNQNKLFAQHWQKGMYDCKKVVLEKLVIFCLQQFRLHCVLIYRKHSESFCAGPSLQDRLL